MRSRLLTLACAALLAACEGHIMDPGSAPLPPGECDPDGTPPAPEPLTWKRVAPFLADLGAALELSPDQLCNELGRIPCRDVHLVPLGGNDAEGRAQYAPVASSLTTTPVAVDRVVLSACENRAELDAASPSSARVFTDVAPDASAVAPGSAAIDAQIASLHRRLLRRAATPDEVAIVRELAVDGGGSPRTGRELDVLACFAIGTTTENVLF